MQIDLFTFVAQIVNFVILVVVLRALLYKRVLRAMDERQERIERDLRDAEETREQAEDEAEHYRARNRELDRRREEILDEAREDADEKRRQWLERAREEAEEARERWRQTVERERESFLADLRGRITGQLCAVSRNALRDIADEELQGRAIEVFLRRVGEAAEKNGLAELGASQEDVTVRTAFELSDEQKARLERELGERLDSRIDFVVAEEVLCGIELQAAGRRIGWSMEAYVDDLERSLGETLSAEQARGRAAGNG